MESPELVRKKLAVFLALTFALSSIFYYLILSSGTVHAGKGLYTLGLMWCPGIAALGTQLGFHRTLRGMGWRWRKTRYQVISYGLPFVYALIAYGFVWISGFGGFYNQEFVSKVSARLLASLEITALSPTRVIVLYLLVASTLGVFGSSISAAGEEIGWRGFLVPNLAKTHSFTGTALISGAIWSIWHYPLIFFADYRSAETPIWYAALCFTVMLFGINFAFCWLRLKSGSVWTGVLLHASHNLFIQQVFTPLTFDTGMTRYFIDEFGAALAVVAIGVGFLFWRRAGEIIPENQFGQ